MRILNLYAGIGGNRKLWGDSHQITAVEFESDIAKEYQLRYPNDTVVVGDAHQYLLDHQAEFDFIWSSPPCPTHGQYRYNVGYLAKGYSPVFPDMKLYEEIIFLQYYFKGKYIVENTKPFYAPLVKPTAILQRHLFWANFPISEKEFGAKHIRSKNKIADFEEVFLSPTIRNKRQVLRNCVDSDLGLHILRCLPITFETIAISAKVLPVKQNTALTLFT